MIKSNESKNLDPSTEERIKAAARTIFYKKGYAATRTRDIAEEAGINLALLNYYFRSKEKLFEIIMLETLTAFMQRMSKVFNNEKTTLEEKVEIICENYIDLIIKEPNIPIFMLSEIRNRPNFLLEKLTVKQLYMHSTFIKQYQEGVAAGHIKQPSPMHFMLNLMSLVIFPIIGKPLLQGIGDLSDAQFYALLQERKKLIPIWAIALMQS